MTDDDRILELQNEISNLTFGINLIDKDDMPDLRDYRNAMISDLEDLRDQLVEVRDTMYNIKYKYSEEEQ